MIHAMAALVLLAAQDGGKKGGEPQTPYWLPSVEAIKAKMGLSDAQAGAISKLYKEYMPVKDAKSKADPRARRDELLAKIAAVLNEEQKATWKRFTDGLKAGDKSKEKKSAP